MHVSQSSLIAFYLFAAFVVFITVRGELSTYVGFFVGGSAPGAVPETATGSSSSPDKKDELSQAQDMLLKAAQLAIIL